MSNRIVTQDRVILYVQPDGPGTALAPLSIGQHGRGDSSDDTIPGKTVIYGRDEFGRAKEKVSYRETPGGGITFQIDKDAVQQLDLIDKKRRDQGKFNIYEYYIPKGALTTVSNWEDDGYVLVFVDCEVVGGGAGGHDKNFSGQPVANTDQIQATDQIKILPFSISAMTTSETEDINGITAIGELDPDNELTGYQGADQIVIAAADAGSSATPHILYSTNGGGSWTAFGADPFAADEHADFPQARIISPSQYRILVGRTVTDGSNPAEIAYADITFGDESSSPTWNAVDVGSTNGDTIEFLYWPRYTRAYAGTGGDVYVSTDQGESWTAIFTGSNALAAAYWDSEENVWFVGASNTILREKATARDTVETLTGPSGGGAFSSIAVASDGTIYAGNGTSLFKNTNDAASAGGWSSLKDFGADHAVVGLALIGKNRELIVALVNDSSGNEGDVWFSLDGGNSFREVTNLSNSGYNAWYFSPTDPNLAYIAGEDDGATGILHKLSA